jgi:hypothetical protein
LRIERILSIFDGLKSYFLSCDKCPKLLFDFFENFESELFLKFLYGTLQLFNNNNVPYTIEEKWKTIFKVFKKTDISCCNISKMIEFAMSLPGTSAPVERVFSIMGNIWLREEHRLRVSENRVLRRIFGPKKDEVTGEWRKLHNEELCDL